MKVVKNIVISPLFAGCRTAPPEYFVVDRKVIPNRGYVREIVAAANPPSSRKELRTAVKAFNQKTIPLEALKTVRRWEAVDGAGVYPKAEE
ncbi:MAG: hypothetical protein LBD37_05795 [Treponema sp.]|jgi:hypothetical protein|nr:hypothetical protein [Treponema sp.]